MKKSQEQINQERNFIQSVLGTRFLGFRTTCETKVAKALLLYGHFHYNGRFLKPRAKSIGAGVYEVWAENT